MDTIRIRDLRVDALIGIHRRERFAPQTVSVDLEIGLPGDAVFRTDRVRDTIDYEQVAARIRALAAEGRFRLVETFAERIARLLLEEFGAPWVRVTAAKLAVLPATAFVGVTIERRRA